MLKKESGVGSQESVGRTGAGLGSRFRGNDERERGNDGGGRGNGTGGKNGKNGMDGTDGTDGKNGKNGMDGTGGTGGEVAFSDRLREVFRRRRRGMDLTLADVAPVVGKTIPSISQFERGRHRLDGLDGIVLALEGMGVRLEFVDERGNVG